MPQFPGNINDQNFRPSTAPSNQHTIPQISRGSKRKHRNIVVAEDKNFGSQQLDLHLNHQEPLHIRDINENSAKEHESPHIQSKEQLDVD